MYGLSGDVIEWGRMLLIAADADVDGTNGYVAKVGVVDLGRKRAGMTGVIAGKTDGFSLFVN